VDEISVASLRSDEPLSQPLYHRTGTLLFRAGQTLSPELISALKTANIHRLYSAADASDLALLKKRTGLYPLAVESLKLNQTLPYDICSDTGVVLLARNHMFHAEYRDTLSRCNIKHVWVPSAESLRELDKFAFQCSKNTADALDKEIESSPALFDIPPDHPPFIERLSRVVHRSAELRRQVISLRTDSCNEAHALLRTLREAATVKTDVPQLVERVIHGFTCDANFLLKLAAIVQQEGLEQDPRADHLINVCLNALAIGAQMKYSEKQMRQLGISAFLHDIGMIRVPTDILLKPGPLANAERFEVDRHTIFAMDLLEQVPSISPAIFMPIYQSHERLDGSGYPKGRKPPFIHEFARIIAIADAYTAICSPRTYRSAKSPHDAISHVISMAANNVFDKQITRAFLHAVGLFPIGSWVLLSSGETARVVSTGPDPKRYDRPTLSLLFNRAGDPFEFPTTLDLSTRSDITISQVLPPDTFSPNNNQGF